MKPKTFLIVALWALAIASVAAYIVARSSIPEPGAAPIDLTLAQPVSQTGELPELMSTPDFKLIDHKGESFDSTMLAGKPWVGFIFLTNCPTGACPMMVGKMGDLQKTLPEGIELVSFSVDPERDTPEVMNGYVERITGDAPSDRWHLLSGESAEQMKALAGEMKLIVDEDWGHSTQFLLVDSNGTVRGIYGNTDETAMGRLAVDAEKLMAEMQNDE